VFGITLRLLVINTSSFPVKNKRRRLPATIINLPRSVADVCIALGSRTVHSTRWLQILAANRDFLPTPPAIDAPVRGSPSEYYHNVWYWKTRMVWLPDSEKILKICLFVSTESTARQGIHNCTEFRKKLKTFMFQSGCGASWLFYYCAL